jgi:hypothetical protein
VDGEDPRRHGVDHQDRRPTALRRVPGGPPPEEGGELMRLPEFVNVIYDHRDVILGAWAFLVGLVTSATIHELTEPPN